MCCISAAHSPHRCRSALYVLHFCITFAPPPPLRALCAALLHHIRRTTTATRSMCCTSASHLPRHRRSALYVLHFCITFAARTAQNV
ncbi:hypothetical protein FHS15_003704 [Paenibacillus castaneae]|nr:hypothetical protein [Paenibacillus castaneae]